MPCGAGARNPLFLAKLSALPPCFFCDSNVRTRRERVSLTESVGVIGPAGPFGGRAAPNRTHSAFRQSESHRGRAAKYSTVPEQGIPSITPKCRRWPAMGGAVPLRMRRIAIIHIIPASRHTGRTDGRSILSSLVGVRLTPRAYVSPAAIQAPARRSVMPAVDWRVIPRSQRFVPKPRRMEFT